MVSANWTMWTVGRCRYCLLAVLVTRTLVAQVAEQPVVLTIDVDGTDSQGRSFHNRLAFDRG